MHYYFYATIALGGFCMISYFIGIFRSFYISFNYLQGGFIQGRKRKEEAINKELRKEEKKARKKAADEEKRRLGLPVTKKEIEAAARKEAFLKARAAFFVKTGLMVLANRIYL